MTGVQTCALPIFLKIQLGLSCNYSCEYCSQRFVPTAEETSSKHVDKFLENLDSWMKETPKKVEFWGGEPLVYFKTLKPLAEALRIKWPDVKFLMITNGSLLTPEINDWLVEQNFSVGISHDGPGQPVRGPDPLNDADKRDNILDLFKRKKRNRKTRSDRDYVNEVLQSRQPRYGGMSSTIPFSNYLRPMNTYSPMESMNTYSEISPMGSFDFSYNFNPGSVVGFRTPAQSTNTVIPIANKTQALDDGIVYSPEGKLRDQFSGAQLEMNYAAMGASIPGSVGFTYARTVGAAPSNGPYAKKTKASAQDGSMTYYQDRKSTRLNSSHIPLSRMPSSA